MTSAKGPRRALISVSDKTGLGALGRALADHDIEILSTGGSATALRDARIPVTEVSAFTGFPEIMGGRVKTLHPRIHGGILARPDIDDEAANTHDLPPIDFVIVNLYPFAATIARPDCSEDEAIENIDIGGPTLLRAAAKNHARVTVVCDPADYPMLVDSLPDAPNAAQRRALAQHAFAHTADYDAQIARWLKPSPEGGSLPEVVDLRLERAVTLRYGENPHQEAAVYFPVGQEAAGVAGAELLNGKPLSYNNLLDADAAWRTVQTLGDEAGCVIVKHTNPCGAAVADSSGAAYEGALACDPTSAFGGIVAFSRPLDPVTAGQLAERFYEVIIAPAFEPEALEVLTRKAALRLLQPRPDIGHAFELRAVSGGWLAQQPDSGNSSDASFRVVTRCGPDAAHLRDLQFAWAVVQAVRSNAIVMARNGATLGIGAGQMSRVDASRIAVMKAADQGLSLDGACLASDAFFPFADGLEAAAEAGVRAIIQPGGSRRDDEVIAAADHHGIAMILTGRRHFRH